MSACVCVLFMCSYAGDTSYLITVKEQRSLDSVAVRGHTLVSELAL